MSLVPDKVRKSKKVVDLEKLDAFVDEGLAQRTPSPPSPEPEPPVRDRRKTSGGGRRDRRSAAKNTPTHKDPSPGNESGDWRRRLHRAPSVAFSVRIPTPLLDRMRDVVSAVDGETLTSLLVEGAGSRVEAIERAYREQVGEDLPKRQEKVEL